MSLLDQLRDKRAAARSAAEAVLTRSAESGVPMTAEDLAEHARAVADEREAADAIEALHSDQLAELRASIARTPGGAGTPAGDVLNREPSEVGTPSSGTRVCSDRLPRLVEAAVPAGAAPVLSSGGRLMGRANRCPADLASAPSPWNAWGPLAARVAGGSHAGQPRAVEETSGTPACGARGACGACEASECRTPSAKC